VICLVFPAEIAEKGASVLLSFGHWTDRSLGEDPFR
jgi:hypothetical protein